MIIYHDHVANNLVGGYYVSFNLVIILLFYVLYYMCETTILILYTSSIKEIHLFGKNVILLTGNNFVNCNNPKQSQTNVKQ